jgi:hypothetical protein
MAELRGEVWRHMHALNPQMATSTEDRKQVTVTTPMALRHLLNLLLGLKQ